MTTSEIPAPLSAAFTSHEETPPLYCTITPQAHCVRLYDGWKAISGQARFLDTAHSHVTLRGEPLLWSVLKLSCTRCSTCLRTLQNRREKKKVTAPRCTVH